jgi:flagellar protein FlaG
MKEITQSVLTPIQAKPVTASAMATTVKPQKTGNSLPPVVQAAKKDSAETKDFQAHVEAAVAQMNEFIQSTQRDLHFSYDKAAGETVVKVLDRGTQQVIRQIPDETFLKLARNRDFDGSVQLLSAQA